MNAKSYNFGNMVNSSGENGSSVKFLVETMCRNRYNTAICTLSTLAAISLIVSLVIPVLINQLVNDGVDEQVIIDSPNAPNYKAWKTNIDGPGAEIKVYYDIYFFDLQNPGDVLNGEKPVLLEVGPYAYNEYFNKFDILC